MRLPRNLSGEQLAKFLSRFGYQVTRQTGSHMRLTRTIGVVEHHITIPSHDPLKVGTLNSILKDIAEHLSISKDELIRKLFD